MVSDRTITWPDMNFQTLVSQSKAVVLATDNAIKRRIISPVSGRPVVIWLRGSQHSPGHLKRHRCGRLIVHWAFRAGEWPIRNQFHLIQTQSAEEWGGRGVALSLVHNPISRLLIRVHQRGTDTSTELQTRVTHLFFSPSPTSDGVASGVSPRADQKGTGWGCAQKKKPSPPGQEVREWAGQYTSPASFIR